LEETNLHPAWQTPLDNLRAQLSGSSRGPSLTDPAFEVIDALQRHPPAIQVEALYLAAVIIASALRLDPHELVSRARRQVRDVVNFETAASSIGDYAKGELV
jgi:hypothetical protein